MDATLNQNLLIATFVCAGILALFLVLNIIRIARGKDSSKLFTILLHIAGIAAAVFNAVRVYFIYEDSKGVMVAANIIVIVSLLISLVRAIRGVPEDEEEDTEE